MTALLDLSWFFYYVHEINSLSRGQVDRLRLYARNRVGLTRHRLGLLAQNFFGTRRPRAGTMGADLRRRGGIVRRGNQASFSYSRTTSATTFR